MIWATEHRDQPNLRIGNLSRTALPPDLSDSFDDVCDPGNVGMREMAAVRVYGQRTTRTGASTRHEAGSLPSFAESQAFQLEDDGHRETIIDFREVDILVTDARQLECTPPRISRPNVEKPRALGKHLAERPWV